MFHSLPFVTLSLPGIRMWTVANRQPYLVAHLSGLLSEGVVLVPVLLDVVFVSYSLHVLQLLVGKLQLLLVMAVLLHLGLKVTQFLLNEQEGIKKKGGVSFSSPCITYTSYTGELTCISSSEYRGNVTEKP